MVTMDAGMERIRCGVKPPYSADQPSSARIERTQWTRPTYLGTPFSMGCRNLVVRT